MKKPCQLVFNAIQLTFLYYTNLKGFLDRPKIHKHNILKKPFETKTN